MKLPVELAVFTVQLIYNRTRLAFIVNNTITIISFTNRIPTDNECVYCEIVTVASYNCIVRVNINMKQLIIPPNLYSY